MNDPRPFQQLSQLQTLDYITGRNDGHLDDMYWDSEKAKLTGIDDDNAFGSRTDTEGGVKARPN